MNKNILTNRFLLLVGLSVILISCSSTQRTVPLSVFENQEIKEDVVHYYLPRNSIKIQFSLKEEHQIPGSFAAYSKELIGVEPDILNESRNFTLKLQDLRIESMPDPEQYYLVEHFSKSIAGKPVFNEDGLLTGFNVSSGKSSSSGKFKSTTEEIDLDLRGDSRYFVKGMGERIDTTYRIIRHDSLGLVQQPVLRKQSVAKSDKEKASDIAAILLDLQQEKLRVLQGDKHELPDGKAFEVVFNEFRAIEERYLPLFYGTIEESSKNIEFSLIPESGLLDSAIILGYYSEKEGFMSEFSETALPISITFTLMSKSDQSDKLRQQMDSLKGNEEIIYLREPANVKVVVKIGEKKIEEFGVRIAQLGSIYRFPIGDLHPRRAAIHINPDLGSFQRISKSR